MSPLMFKNEWGDAIYYNIYTNISMFIIVKGLNCCKYIEGKGKSK